MVRGVLIAVLAVPTSGCFLFGGGREPQGGGGGVDRCEQDRYFCKDEADLELDPTCTLTGDLIVTIGQGVEAFEPLAQGEPIVTYEAPGGGFQGGGGGGGDVHGLVGLRIEGVETEEHEELLATIELWDEEQCPPGEDPCVSPATLGYREVLLGSGPPLEVVSDGMVEDWALTFLIDFGAGTSGDYVLQATVTDPCQRSGRAQHRYGP